MKISTLLLTLALIAAPVINAAAPGDMQEGKWVQISVPSGVGSTIRTVWPNTGSAAVKDVKNVMAYSGGAFATGLGSRGSLIVFGGGHGDYAGNEVYAFGIETGLWSLVGTPSPTSVCTYSTSRYADGKPCSPHTYDATEYAPSTNELFKIGPASDYSAGGGGTGNIDAFSFNTNSWTRKGRLATFQDECSTGSGEAGVSAYDSVNQVLWWHGVLSKYGGPAQGGACGTAGGLQANILQKISPTTGATTASYLGANIGIDGIMAFAPELKALILLDQRSAKELHVWDVATGTPVRYLNVAYTGPFPSGSDGFDWDPIALKGVSYGGTGSSVITLTPPVNWATTKTGTWTFATVAAGTGSAVPTETDPYTWTFGRFRYVPALCGFVNASGVDLPVFAYRLTGGAGAGCGTAPPVDPLPSLVFTGSPLSINTGSPSTLTWSTSNVSSCTASGGWSGTKATAGTQVVTPTVTTIYVLSCLGVGTQIATSTSRDVTIIVNTPGGGTADFATRCAALGVVRCNGFETDAEVVPETTVFKSDNNIYPTRDTSQKASGNSSLRFSIPATVGANVAGYWLQPLWDEARVGGTATAHFAPGETFYMQYRQRMDSNFHNTDWYSVTSGGYPKQWIMHTPGSSCVTLQFVAVERYDTDVPMMYASCGSTSLFVGLPDGDDYIQQGAGVCLRRTAGPDCKKYTSDNWMTFYYKFTLAAFGSPTTRVEAWMGWEGEARTKYIDIPDFILDFSSSSSEKLYNLQLTPYMTGRNGSAVLPVSNTWYDDLIVSTQEIAWPAGGTALPAPTLALIAGPPSVASGSTSLLIWDSTNATSCTASGAWSGTKPNTGTQNTDPLTVNTSYTLTCTGSGGSIARTVVVAVTATPPAVTLTATPLTVTSGNPVSLTWSVLNATSCTASGGWSGAKNATTGSEVSLPLTASTSFTLTCTGAGGTGFDTKTVSVTTPLPTINTLTATPSTVDYSGKSMLSWTTSNATSCAFIAGYPTIPFDVPPPITSRITPVLTAATVFTLSCGNAVGTAQRSVTVGVNPVPNPTVTLTATPPTIASAGTSSLTWGTTNAASCAASGDWTGARAAGGGTESTGALTATKSYTMTCTAANGATAAATAQVIVNTPDPAPVVILFSGATQIQSGTATTLFWDSSNATSCEASGGWSGTKAIANNESTGNLTANTTFVLICTGAGGTGSSSLTITVTAGPVPANVDIFAWPSSTTPALGTTIAWSSTNTTSCIASAGGGNADWLSQVGVAGSLALTPAVTTTYTMTCTNGVTTDASSVTVTVGAPAKSVDLTATLATIVTGNSTTLNWATTGSIDTCVFVFGLNSSHSGASGSVSTGVLTLTRVYTIACYDSAGDPLDYVADSVTVTVTGSTRPRPGRRFRPWWLRR